MKNIGQKKKPYEEKKIFTPKMESGNAFKKRGYPLYIFLHRYIRCSFHILNFPFQFLHIWIFEIYLNLINLTTQLRSKQKQVKLCIIIKYHQFKILSTCVDARRVVTGILTFNFPFFVVLETTQKKYNL